MDINGIMDTLMEGYRKAHEGGDMKQCGKLLEIFRTIGVVPKEDKLDTINRMAGKKKNSIM